MSFITRKHLSRRTLLRGVGVSLGLPLLDSMIPAQTPLSKTAAAPKLRFTGIFVPHGMAPGYWIPDGPVLQADKLPTIMEPLAPFVDRTTILSGNEFNWRAGGGLSFSFANGYEFHAIGRYEPVTMNGIAQNAISFETGFNIDLN